MNRVNAWAFRLQKEAERASSAFFLTLTYDVEFVPITKNHFMTLAKRDLQLFFKRLRKSYGKQSTIKYYACGEYGTITMRPHYHIILFNADEINIKNAWRDPNTLKPIGHIHYGQVEGNSIAYTLKYMTKKSVIPLHPRDDRQKEFSLMSKKLGDNYLNEKMINWHKADILNRMYIPTLDNYKIAMPRYYKEKIYTQFQRQQISQHIQNQQIKEFQNQNLSTREKNAKKQHNIATAKTIKNNKKDNRNSTL